VEHVQPGRPAARPPGQHGRVLGQQRLGVDVAEQALDLPRAEAQRVLVDQVHRAELVTVQVDAGHPAAREHGLDGGGAQQAFDVGLGGRAVQEVEVVHHQKTSGRDLS
jgi:hypothetical protein